MAEARLNANELARYTGIPASSIKKIRNNNNPNPTLSTLAPLANYFSVTISQLIGDNSPTTQPSDTINVSETNIKMIPIIKWDEIIHWPSYTKPNYLVPTERPYTPNSFGLMVEEETWEVFQKDTLLLIEPIMTPQQHDYVIVKKDTQAVPTLKRVLIEDGEIFFKSILIDNYIVQNSSEYVMIGVVMEYRNYLRKLVFNN